MAYTKQTHCKQGHEYVEGSYYVATHKSDGRQYRQCRICHRADAAQRRAERKATLTPEQERERVRAFPSYAKTKHYMRKYRYGVTEAEYRAMLHEQDGLCLICTTEGATHVDHDHATGRIRGILCGPCNRGLGLFNDDPDALVSAAEYVKGAT